jgi:hypothetical protein
MIMTSFATVEELYFPTLRVEESIFTRGRGGACCIRVNRKLLQQQHNATITNKRPHHETPLLIGVQHVKTPSQRNRKLASLGNKSSAVIMANHYLSQFYAFEAEPPFRLVALSGLFCLGFPQPNDPDYHAVPALSVTTWRKLILGRNTPWECPRIHFVSGITYKVNDPTTVVLTYGINDCVARIVEVSIEDILSLLFDKPPQTIHPMTQKG